jgi:hypothetical protein
LSTTDLFSSLRRNWATLCLLILLPAALFLRAYGLNWDQGLFIHPDERRILMVAVGLSWPTDWRQLLSASSPWNPGFFAYGSFPIYLLRIMTWLVSLRSPDWSIYADACLVGRFLSAVFDTLSVYATYRLAGKLAGRRAGLLAAVLVTLTVLHIQLAHFYAVDTLLTALILLATSKAVDVARHGRRRDGLALGAWFGIALATKISVLPFAAVIVVAWASRVWPTCWNWRKGFTILRAVASTVWRQILLTMVVAALIFVLLQPYAVLDLGRFAQGIGQEIAMSQGWYDFTYTRQYDRTVPYLYQARQVLYFAMGLPLGLFGFAGFFWWLVMLVRRPQRDWWVALAWPMLYSVLQGAAYAKFIRYTLPLLPFLCLAGAAMWVWLWDRAARIGGRRVVRCALAVLLIVVLLWSCFYAVAFLNVYRQTHPWIQASVWLCSRLEDGDTVLVEYWDDPLPAALSPDEGGCAQKVNYFTVDFHASDDEAKLEGLLDAIRASKYIALSSQRLYATLPRLAGRFPLSTRYYQQLFAERLGFQLVSAPAVYPQWAGLTLLDNPRAGLGLSTPALLAAVRPNGLVLDLGRADESFTVYDHPQPLIFEKTRNLSRSELESLLQP